MRCIAIAICLLGLCAPAHSENFKDVILVSVLNENTIQVKLPGIHIFHDANLSVRIRGMTTPPARPECQPEQDFPLEGVSQLNLILLEANVIDLIDVERWKYYWVIASVQADGIDVTHILFEMGGGVEKLVAGVADGCE